MGVLPACVCAEHTCSVHRGQKMALDVLDLNVQMFAICHVDAEN